ncbi:MAG: S8 family serine peptidase [Phycisphaerae bacterium]|nr:S8 family serine peptidase [Phycisphaerae bacterium]
MKRSVFSAMLAAAALAASLIAGVAQVRAGQYLVVAAGNDFPDSRVQAVQQAGGQVVKVFPQIGVAVAISDDPDFPAKAKAITGLQSVVPDPVAVIRSDTEPLPAEPASKQKPAIEKGADLTGLQWGLQAVQAPAAWALGFTGKGVRVAVLDGGIMTTHPDLAPNLNLQLSTSVVPGETVEFIPGAGSGNRSHATHVAGIIAAADNGFGTTGVAPDVELVAIKIGSDRAYSTRMSWAVEGILYAAQIRADVANMSFAVAEWMKNAPPEGVAEIDIAYSVAFRAIRWAEQQGTLLVAAAGNEALDLDGGGNCVEFPRDVPGILAVAATAPRECWAFDHTVNLDWPAPYTDYGQRVIDLAAPGGSANPSLSTEFVTLGGATFRAFAFNMVLSTSSDFGATSDYEKKGSWNFAGGTSSAAPHVCGVAALAIQAHGSDLTPAQIRTILEQSADDLGDPGNDDFYGAGRVNALRAVQQ